MKKIVYLLFITWIVGILPNEINAQADGIPEGIVLSFKAGNATELSKFFHSTIELIILDKEDVYSRSQAEQIIRKFFSEHKPGAFRIIFEGGKENSRYAIGNLQTPGQTYRVYILLKNQDGSPFIHQLRIEEEDDNDQ